MFGLQISQLINTDSTEAIWEEVQAILRLIPSDFDMEPVAIAWETAVALYKGHYPGYQACSTPYHDLNHVADVFLAMARLIHGAVLDGRSLTNRNIAVGLTAAIFHDAGLIQEVGDFEGTGAKYLTNHDQRSMELLEQFCHTHGWAESDIEAARFMIGCTDSGYDVAAIMHHDAEIEQLAQLLAAADLIAQAADRVYLEKLLFLYHELKEGHIGDYASEIDLLQRTGDFYDYVIRRLSPIEPIINRYTRRHFVARWQIDINLYADAMIGQMLYLQDVLRQPDDPRNHLRRQDIVRRVHEIYGED